MAVFNNVQLSLDIKAQDRLRQWFSQRGSSGNVLIKCVGLGDSDVDYEMTQQYTRMKILNAPYNVPRIKHHLVYSGDVLNVTGVLSTFLRRVNDLEEVESLYSYPPDNTNFTAGIIPPTLANGYDFLDIIFDTLSVVREGFIVYFQTLPDNYLDSDGVQQRLVEQYDFTFNNVPSSWEVIVDQTNGSFLIAKPAGYVFTTQQGSILIKGQDSSITKTILFNY